MEDKQYQTELKIAINALKTIRQNRKYPNDWEASIIDKTLALIAEPDSFDWSHLEIVKQLREIINKALAKKYKLEEPRYGEKKEISVGRLATEYGIPIGYLGCPYCGTVISGAFHSRKCIVCNEDLFKRKNNET